MRTTTRWLAVALIVGLVVMTGTVWAQEEEQAKTPQQVVTEFADALAVYTFVYYYTGEEFPHELLSDDSQKAIQELYDEVTAPLIAWIVLPRLIPVVDISPEGDAVVVVATPQPRPVSVVVIKERGQWKVDLLATLDKLPEPFRPDVESMRQQLDELETQAAGLPGLAAPQPQAGEETPAADTGEAEQTSSVIEITLDNFKGEVLEAELPVLLEFWAQDCDACTDLKPVFDELARDYVGTVRFGSVDFNRNIPLVIAYEVNRIPCLVLFHSGEELARTTGYMNKQQLQDWIEQNLAAQD